MDTKHWILGVMKVQRGPSASDPYTIEELPGTVQLTGSDEVDLVPYYNGSWVAVTNLCDNLIAAQLCQDIEAGIIIVTERTEPVRKGPEDEP